MILKPKIYSGSLDSESIRMEDGKILKEEPIAREIVIGDYFIHLTPIIIQYKTVGENVIIGAGSVDRSCYIKSYIAVKR